MRTSQKTDRQAAATVQRYSPALQIAQWALNKVSLLPQVFPSDMFCDLCLVVLTLCVCVCVCVCVFQE